MFAHYAIIFACGKIAVFFIMILNVVENDRKPVYWFQGFIGEHCSCGGVIMSQHDQRKLIKVSEMAILTLFC